MLRIIARLNVGGPAIQTINLTHRLRQRGYDTVLLRGQEGPQEGTMDHLADRLDVDPVFVPGLRRGLGLHDLRALIEVWRWILRYRPQVLHTHTAKAGALGRLAARLAGPARPRVVVHTFHGHVFEGEFSERTSRLLVRIERWLAKRATRVIAVSDEVGADLIRLGVAPPERVEVIRLGFDLTPFTLEGDVREDRRRAVRSRLGIPDGATLVTLIARVVKVKRVDRFLDMATRLNGSDDLWFLVAGDGDRRQELAQTPAARALGTRLVWAGFERDIADICFASDVVVLTSDNEGTPVCLIEAQAAGLPVVTTRVGGVQTVVLDGQTGMVVDKDAEQLASAVRGLIGDPNLRRRLGARGREHVLDRFSVERLVEDVDGLYRRLLME